MCENLCETFLKKLPKIWEIAFFLEIEFLAITAIANVNNEGVKLEGYDYECLTCRLEDFSV